MEKDRVTGKRIEVFLVLPLAVVKVARSPCLHYLACLPGPVCPLLLSLILLHGFGIRAGQSRELRPLGTGAIPPMVGSRWVFKLRTSEA